MFNKKQKEIESLNQKIKELTDEKELCQKKLNNIEEEFNSIIKLNEGLNLGKSEVLSSFIKKDNLNSFRLEIKIRNKSEGCSSIIDVIPSYLKSIGKLSDYILVDVGESTIVVKSNIETNRYKHRGKMVYDYFKKNNKIVKDLDDGDYTYQDNLHTYSYDITSPNTIQEIKVALKIYDIIKLWEVTKVKTYFKVEDISIDGSTLSVEGHTYNNVEAKKYYEEKVKV